ncbi:ABZJ_00895 family protein [Gordonia sp. HY002]|uniref:ABZJ_00895 family protein n=1 Tax=Gordonia zhenghanii TaxID=2911516 RepID=UPI001EF1337D|nr:ABZJ_00895 family protein [Gordonia zhenghanii]MCF8571575.1 ABZJ_00895 family protein [Gordonia zhenghanii]MCF8602172.1 ABZJ_00895 family protein [Gordonia zhenghanii]
MNVWKYVGWYALGYLGAVIVIGVVGAVIGGSTSTGAIVPVVASFAPIGRFVTDFRRIPTPSERRTLFGACVGFFLVLQVAIVIGATAMYPDEAGDVISNGGAVAVVLFVGVALPIGFMWLTFRYMPAKNLKNILKVEAKKAARAARRS